MKYDYFFICLKLITFARTGCNSRYIIRVNLFATLYFNLYGKQNTQNTIEFIVFNRLLFYVVQVNIRVFAVHNVKLLRRLKRKLSCNSISENIVVIKKV